MKKYPILAAILAITLVLSGCSARSGNPTIPTLLDPVSGRSPVEAAYVDDIFKMDLYTLSVVPYVEEITSEISGSVDEIYYYPGKLVEKGEILLTLDLSSVRNAVTRLEKQMADSLATQQYTEAIQDLDLQILEVELRQLQARGADPVQIALKENEIKQQKLEQESQRTLWALDRKEDEAELAELKASLEGGVLRAPFSGRVAYSLNLTQGSRLEASLPFCYIADDNRLTLAGPDMPQYFFDNADDAYIITGSSECRFLLLDETQREEMTPNVSGVGYYLPVDDQGNPISLSLGQSAQLCVIRYLTENALLIPYAAIQKDGEQQYVYVYENGNKVRRDITTGLWQNGMAHVTSGLEEGAYVYVG